MTGSNADRITAAVLGWPGTETVPHRFGGTEFRLGRRQLGHIHGSHVADLPLPRALRVQLVESGRAEVHRWRPDSGWVTIPLTSPQAVAEVIDQLRAAYERALRARRRAAGAESPELSSA